MPSDRPAMEIQQRERLCNVSKLLEALKRAGVQPMDHCQKLNFLHQSTVAILNILDVEVSLCTSSLTCPKCDVIKLYKQRLSLQKDLQNTQLSSLQVSPFRSLQGSLTFKDMASRSVSSILLEAVSTLKELCTKEWGGGIFQEGEEPDPLNTGGSSIDMQSRPHFLQQLNYLRSRCIELEESEKAAVGTHQCIFHGGQTQREDDKMHHDNEMFDPSNCSLDECIWRIDERLQGYEECVGRLFADLQNWKSEKWMKTLEDNHRLLTGSRWVKKMLESCLILAERESGTLTRVEVDIRRRLLKLSSKCFAALPLPLQSCVFQWLWEQPKGRVLYQVDCPINVQQELTRVFNHLVTGAVDTQIIKAAQEFYWVALHSLGPALQKTIEEAVSSQDAGKLLCKVLQCLPFLLRLEVDSLPCFLTEFRKFVGVFCEEDHQSTEKLNLLRFTESLIQPYQSPTHPSLGVRCLPLIPPATLAEHVAWPLMSPETSQETSVGYPPRTETDSPSGVRREIALRVLDLTLDTGLSLPGDAVFDAGASFSALLCLCQMLEECHPALVDRGGGGDGRWFVIKELVTDLCRKFAEHVKRTLKGDAVSCGIRWLFEETEDMDWLTRLTVNALFLDVEPECKKNIALYVAEVIESFAAESKQSIDSVPSYLARSTLMIAFFQGCCISVEVRDLFFQDLPKTLLARSSEDFYQAVCLALCQVLPSCTMSEWQAIRGTLEQLIVDKTLDTSYSTEFVTGLPMFDMTAYRCPLLLCQIFTTTIQLLTSHKVCQFDWMIPQVWHQAVKNYAHIMKDILNSSADIYANNLLDATGFAPSAFLFVIGQLFCHSCKVAGCVPPSSSELLFVWCLELVSQAADLMTRHPGDSSLSNAARQQAKTLCSVLSWMPGSEHQAMLQLKIDSLLGDVR